MRTLSYVILLALLASSGCGDVPREEAAAPAGSEAASAPDDVVLRGIDGRSARLGDLRGEIVVLAFNGVECPISKLLAGRLRDLAAEYAPRGVRFFGVNANVNDGVEDLREFAANHRLEFPMVKDEGAVIADALGAERTTDVFVIDRDGRLRFHGPVDDQYTLVEGSAMGGKARSADNEWLRVTLDALLDGRPVPEPRLEAPGCLIGRPRPDEFVTDAPVTFFRDIEPIVQRRCQDCHRPGEVAGFSLLTYDEAAGWSRMMREVVRQDRMPPWSANPAHGEFTNDRRMTAEEKARLLQWIELGAPAGDPAERPAPREFTSGWRIPEPDIVLTMPEPFTVPASGVVEYHNVVFDHEFTEDVMITAMEFRPGAREVVHHIMAFLVPPGGISGWTSLDGGKMGYFGLMAPGCEPTVFPEGMAKRIPKGSRIHLVIHYQPNGTEVEDVTTLGLVTAKKPVDHEVFTESAYNNTFVIQPGAPATPVSAVRIFDRDTTIISLNPHMHYRGAAWRYEVYFPNVTEFRGSYEPDKLPVVLRSLLLHDEERGTLRYFGPMNDDIEAALMTAFGPPGQKALARLKHGVRSEILLDVPRYDFGWQDTYWFAKPRTFPAGTLLLCTGVFDNSTRNPYVDAELAAQTVIWGEQSADEMMQGYYDYFYEDGCEVPQADRDRVLREERGLQQGDIVVPDLGAAGVNGSGRAGR